MNTWTVGSFVTLVCFISVASLPWLWLLGDWEWYELVGAGLLWLIIGTFAAVNSAQWKKVESRKG